jgi:hypothetical protein
MMKQLAVCMSLLAVLASAQRLSAQTKTGTQDLPAKTAVKAATPEEQNIKAYIKLLREDVSKEKATLMGAVMQLDAEDAARFWPIYRDYDAELSKINDLRVANLMEYARAYNQMTDAKADELIKKSMEYQTQRANLLVKYYELMKGQLGAITAARFVQVEHQLLLIIDLKVTSALPVVGS